MSMCCILCFEIWGEGGSLPSISHFFWRLNRLNGIEKRNSIFLLFNYNSWFPLLLNELKVTESEGHSSIVETAKCWCWRFNDIVDRLLSGKMSQTWKHLPSKRLNEKYSVPQNWIENGFKKEFNWGKNQKSFFCVHLVHFTSTCENGMDLLWWRTERIYQRIEEWHFPSDTNQNAAKGREEKN